MTGPTQLKFDGLYEQPAPASVGRSAQARAGLDALDAVPLPQSMQLMLDAALATNAGSPTWRTRKAAEARQVFALSAVAPRGRMAIQHLDLSGEIRLCVGLGVPVPYHDARGLQIADYCVVGLVYPAELVAQPISGRMLAEVIAPRNIFHPAVASVPPMPQVMCLGSIPAAIRLTELVLNIAAGLAFTNVDMSAFDALGALNAEAMRYWQDESARLPLTKKGFLEE
jgi:hypothetical protein